jgi:thymidylate synthase
MTTKRIFMRGVIAEFLMFLGGRTDTSELEKQDIFIWNGNTGGGEMGPMYGYQWRNFGGTGLDQIKQLIDGIKMDPTGRRHLLTTYNPVDAPKGVLYPCWGLINQFYVDDNGALHMTMYQRSADWFLGVPFNIVASALLLHYIAKKTDLVAATVTINFGDVHLYTNHIEVAKKQLEKEIKKNQRVDLISIDEEKITYDKDAYKPHGKLAATMNA